MSGVSEISVQLLVLTVLAGGGGWWLWRLTGRPALGRGYAWLWFALAGLALGILLLQSLLYCGVPLRISTWAWLAVALAGAFIALWEWKRQGGALRSGLRREMGAAFLVFGVALAGQSPPLLQHGPARFYGTGSYDHGNYVAMADMFIDVPLTIEADTVGYRPWLAPVLEHKERRITQSVLLGAVAVASRSSGQEAYGATNLFLVALAGLATMGCLRVLGVPRWFAACAGMAAALSPALTRVHLEGYFSQTASLFVLPALAGIFGAKGPLRLEAKVGGAVLLAYLASTYSEIAPFGLALVAVLVGLKPSSWRLRLRWLLQIALGVVLLNPGYWGRLAAFLAEQWHVAGGAVDYGARFPDAGTVAGWGRLYFARAGEAGPQIAGVLWGALMVLGICWLLRVRRFAVLVPFGMALGAVAILCLQASFPGYIFTKLCFQFAPFGIAIAITGLLALAPSRYWQHSWLRGVALLAVVTCWWGAEPWRRQVMEPVGVQARLASAQLLAVRQAVEADSERTYLVACDDPVLAQWLCYFGRKASVVVTRRTVGDLILPTETFTCRRWNGSPADLYWLDPARSGPVSGYEPAPTLTVEGAREVGTDDDGRFYVAGNSVDLVFHRGAGESPRPVWLDFVVVPWQAGQGCELELADPAGHRWRVEVQRPEWCRWPLTLPPGTTRLRLSLRRNAQTGDEPVALVKRFSVETAATLPPWQRIAVAEPAE